MIRLCVFNFPLLFIYGLPRRLYRTEHPNVKAFISHCGLSGMYEAIYTATPVISCPLMFDQLSNAAILEHLGVAVHLDIESITKESLLGVINAIFNDTR